MELHGLTLQTVIGVYEWERVAARPLIFDLWMDSEQGFTVSQEQMQQCLRDWVAVCRYRLLEALAEHIAQKLISELYCQRVCIAIEKPGALGEVVRVGIRITRYVVAQKPRQIFA